MPVLNAWLKDPSGPSKNKISEAHRKEWLTDMERLLPQCWNADGSLGVVLSIIYYRPHWSVEVLIEEDQVDSDDIPLPEHSDDER
jgi:hypothetical protein